MPIQPGTRLGPYEISSSLGAGGMGEVYRARDTRLNRDVAIKVLPELLATDADRLARFDREAQVLASLNHPHIAQVHGVLDQPAALVMELVEGEDLSQRIARGALPVREALEIARQIADALEAAHEKGIVHRDLKPANVKVRDDGTVKVLDFGLAKAVAQGLSPAGSGSPEGLNYENRNSPTITSPAAMTAMGVILGTAAYMAPEQAKGKSVDRGADLWAFGVVLYEMLTGKAAFGGETVTDVLAAIVLREPDWNALPGDTPRAITRLLRRCLERDRRRRLADAGEARFQVEEALASPGAIAETAAPAALTTPSTRTIVPWGIATVLAVAVGVLAFRAVQNPAAIVARYSLENPPKTTLSLTNRPALTVSPDGSTVIFVATVDGVDRLYLRKTHSFDATAIPATEGGSNPVISPDGRWLAFTTGTKLMKIPVSGGPAVALADVQDPRGLSWDTNDTIVYAPNTVGGVFQVPASGGAPVQMTTPKANVERTHRWPQMLPGGNAVLYTVGTFGSPDNYDGAVVEALLTRSGERRPLLTGAAMARYVSSGHLLFMRGTTLFAVRFDPKRVEVNGTPAAVLQGIGVDSTTGAAHFAVSPSGTFVYISAGSDAASLLPMWVDRSGRAEPLPLPPGAYSDPRISPDGQQLAVSIVAGGGRDVWVHHFQRKTFTRLTFGGQNLTPVWAADGSMLYYVTLASDSRGSIISRRASDGSRNAESLVSLPDRAYLNHIAADGQSAILDVVTSGPGRSDIQQIALKKDAKPQPVIATTFEEFVARLSPDGRWVAYTSLESGRPEIYVRPTSGGGRWQVSTNGGEEPKWSPDGKQLYYRNGNLLMGAAVETSRTFEASPPSQVIGGIYNLRNDSGISYDVDPKTGRFLMIRLSEESAGVRSLRLVVNWLQDLREAMAK